MWDMIVEVANAGWNVWLMLMFFLLIGWALWPTRARQDQMDHAAQIPFQDDEPVREGASPSNRAN